MKQSETGIVIQCHERLYGIPDFKTMKQLETEVSYIILKDCMVYPILKQLNSLKQKYYTVSVLTLFNPCTSYTVLLSFQLLSMKCFNCNKIIGVKLNFSTLFHL